jgi:hypothetical protein
VPHDALAFERVHGVVDGEAGGGGRLGEVREGWGVALEVQTQGFQHAGAEIAAANNPGGPRRVVFPDPCAGADGVGLEQCREQPEAPPFRPFGGFRLGNIE